MSRTDCAADLKCDGTVNSRDFFDFVAAIFSLAPSADFNAGDQTNSQDFFDLMASVFAGCG